MGQKTTPVNITPEAKKLMQETIRKHFPPGTLEWAVATDLVLEALKLWERGDLEIARFRRPAGGSAQPRNRSNRAPRGPVAASDGEPAGVVANGHLNGSEEHAPA